MFSSLVIALHLESNVDVEFSARWKERKAVPREASVMHQSASSKDFCINPRHPKKQKSLSGALAPKFSTQNHHPVPGESPKTDHKRCCVLWRQFSTYNHHSVHREQKSLSCALAPKFS